MTKYWTIFLAIWSHCSWSTKENNNLYLGRPLCWTKHLTPEPFYNFIYIVKEVFSLTTTTTIATNQGRLRKRPLIRFWSRSFPGFRRASWRKINSQSGKASVHCQYFFSPDLINFKRIYRKSKIVGSSRRCAHLSTSLYIYFLHFG